MNVRCPPLPVTAGTPVPKFWLTASISHCPIQLKPPPPTVATGEPAPLSSLVSDFAQELIAVSQCAPWIVKALLLASPPPPIVPVLKLSAFTLTAIECPPTVLPDVF